MALALHVRELWLPEPQLGGHELRHDRGFEAIDATFDTIRDTVNFGIRQLNHLPGCDLPTITDESLEELVVQPLTGDYPRLRQGADACRIAARALAGWSVDVGAVPLRTRPAWEGASAQAFVRAAGETALAADGAASALRVGAMVFEELADFAEFLAVRAEHLLDELWRALERLAKRVLERLAGPVGVAAVVVDVLRHGADVVTDLIGDVHTVIELVEGARDLVQWARGRVEELAHQLRSLTELRALLPTPVGPSLP